MNTCVNINRFEKCLKEDDEEWMELWDLESRTWDLIQRLYSYVRFAAIRLTWFLTTFTRFRLSEQQEHIQSHAFSSRAVLEEEYYSQNPEAFENNVRIFFIICLLIFYRSYSIGLVIIPPILLQLKFEETDGFIQERI